MLTEETHAAGVADKIASHEESAHEKRNWVRLTFDCNDHCIFCLDSDAHDGQMRDREEVKAQILDGRRKGATRLILSGGEPTIHPSYVDFIRLGALAGYRRIQTVTNGRLFSYKEFLGRCLDAGLGEITFSIHGPNAKVHDALVGTKGAFDEELAALRHALADGRPIVNIDVVVNRANVKHLPEMLRMFTEMGVKEFDLLQVVPFGRAYTDGRETLFYDIAEMRPHLQEALAYSKRPDVHIWMNRFPPQHLEGYEHLIQDPHKLNDEVRGRKEEFARLTDEGIWLDCREPARCKHCYLEKLCDGLERELDTLDRADFEVLRVDLDAEVTLPPVYGGDPASAKRSREEAKRMGGKTRLPLAGEGSRREKRSLEEVVAASGAHTLCIVAKDLAAAAPVIARFPSLAKAELDLTSYAGLEDAAVRSRATGGRTLTSARARTPADAEALLSIEGDFEVTLDLTRDAAAWLTSRGVPNARLALHQPTYDRVTEAALHDADLPAFFAEFRHAIAVSGVPACILGRAPRPERRTLDAAMLAPDGGLEIFRYARRYVSSGYRTKSLRCGACAERERCAGLHINTVRAHGYGWMKPIA